MGSVLIEARQKVHIVRETCYRPDLIVSQCMRFDLEVEVQAEGETAQQALANLSKGIQRECDAPGINNYGKKKATVCEKLGQPTTLEMCRERMGPIVQFLYNLFD